MMVGERPLSAIFESKGPMLRLTVLFASCPVGLEEDGAEELGLNYCYHCRRLVPKSTERNRRSL